MIGGSGGGLTVLEEPNGWLAHDPEQCAWVYRKDHAQTKSQSAMTIQLYLIAL
jgi:hypothetical protein